VSDLATCAIHRDVPAGWQCEGDCKKRLCGDCTARATNLWFCCLCGGGAAQITVARSDRAFSSWLVRAFAYPVTRGLPFVAGLAILVGGVAFTLRELGPDYAGWSVAIRSVLVLLFALLVVDSSARGGVGERGVALRLLRGAAATAIIWLPPAASAYFLGPPHDWTGYLLLGYAAAYLPIALAVAVTDISFADAVNPFKVFALAWALGRRYVATLGSALVLGAIAFGAAGAADKLGRSVTAPVVGDIVAVLPAIALFAVVLHVIGLLVYVHGEALGFGAAALFRDPVLPDETARGKRKDAAVLTTEALTKGSDPLASGASMEERNDVRKIADFLKEENLPRALKLYESRATWSATAFDDRQLLALGKAAVRVKKHDQALELFEQGIAKGGRGASQLYIAKAQVFADTKRADDAKAIYKQIVELFPGTDAAKIASQKL
jgi:tetratricopeptide (TPR) repeat protein